MHLDRPLALRAAALGVAAGVLGVVGQFLPALLDASTPAQVGLPLFVVSTASVLVSPVLVLVVGYRAGTRRNVAREYDTVALSIAAGGALGYLPGYALALLALPHGVDRFVLVLAGTAAYNAVVKAGWFAIAGVAGAAVGYFRTQRRHRGASGPT